MIRFLVSAALLLSSASALAQGKDEPTEAQRAKAKALVAEAQEAYQNDDFELCAKKFQRAFHLAPLPQIQFNLGLCYEKLERFRDASIEYEAAAESEAMSPDMRRKAKDSLDAMRKQMANIRIEGSAARGTVDGSISCKIPCSLFLEPGEHEIVFGKDQKQSFSATRGRDATVVLRKQETTEFDATKPNDGVRTDLTSADVSKSAKSDDGGVGWLTWGGAGLAAAGTTGALVFGLKTRSLHDEFMGAPSASLADEGLQMRQFTNISIGVAALGASLAIYDLLID